MRVRDVMRRAPSACSPGMDLAKVGRRMAEIGCGMMPVVGDEDRVVGVITDRDLGLTVARRDLRPSEIEVRQAITGEVVTCKVDDELEDAVEVMGRWCLRRLPVLDHQGMLAGVLCLDDVFAEVRARPEAGGPSLVDLVETLGRIGQQQSVAVNRHER